MSSICKVPPAGRRRSSASVTCAVKASTVSRMRREALSFIADRDETAGQAEMAAHYADYFAAYVRRGAALELLDGELTRYALARLGAALRPERDLQFAYLGLQTVYDRYLLHSGGVRFELPQA